MEQEKQEYKYMVCTRCFTYNHAPYVVDAMNGFAMQETTFPVITCIVDDASTDNEQEVICQYISEYFEFPYREEDTDDFHLICANHKDNHNCSFVVFLLKYNHYSIKKPKMPYLAEWLDNAKYHAFCEGDDYWIVSDKLQKEVNLLENDPTIGIVRTNAHKLVQEDGRIIKNFMTEPPYDRIKDTFEDYLVNAWFNAPLTTIWRAEAAEKILTSSKYTVGNLPRILSITKDRYRSVFMNEATAVYRVLKESASHTSDITKKYDFKNEVLAVQEDYSKDLSFRVRYKIFVIAISNRLLFLMSILKKYIIKVFKDLINDWRYLIKSNNRI